MHTILNVMRHYAIHPKDGMLRVPQDPGFGIEVDRFLSVFRCTQRDSNSQRFPLTISRAARPLRKNSARRTSSTAEAACCMMSNLSQTMRQLLAHCSMLLPEWLPHVHQAARIALRWKSLSCFSRRGLDRLWNYACEGAMLSYSKSWIDQLRSQRLKLMEKLAGMLLDHLERILKYCRTKVPLGVVEAVNGNIKAPLRRGCGYRDLNYLLLKAQRLATTKTQFIILQKAA